MLGQWLDFIVTMADLYCDNSFCICYEPAVPVMSPHWLNIQHLTHRHGSSP